MTLKRVLGSMLWFILLTPFATIASAQSTGVIAGTVLDQVTERPLPGAAVKLEGSALSTDTDRSGAFQLLRVPAGPQKITVSYLGYEVGTFVVEVKPGETSELK